MKGCTSAVIFYTILELNLCIARHHERSNFDATPSNVQIPCDTDQQCKAMELKGYRCIDNICTCENNMKCEEPNLKTTVTKIGQNCTDTLQCKPEQSFCNDGKCECIENTISTHDKRKCLSVTKEIGLRCDEDIQCGPLGGICADNECRCSSNMSIRNGVCLNHTELGSPCVASDECPDSSKCKNGVCACSKKYIQSSNATQCILKATEISSPCFENVQCSSTFGSGAACSNGSCSCMDLFHFKSSLNKCVMDVLLGEVCTHHDDCHQPGREESRLSCFAGVCKCKSPYYETDGYCISSGTILFPFGLLHLLPFIVSYVIFYVLV